MRRRDADRVRRDVAIRVAEERRKLGWTQDEFAVRCDVTPHWIRQVESGNANLTIGTLVALAEQLDLDVAALFRTPKSRKAGPGRPKAKRTRS
jgi:transcriptional regulator with XRE-family HTH domain